VRACDKYELLEDALYRRTFKDGEPSRAIVVPLKLRPAILSRHHFSMADGGGHVGGETMFRQLRAHYWWAGMERECHSFAAACEKCGSTRSQATIPVPIGGIGGIFYTRKGNFLYKISLYIIIYLDYIIVYHVYHSLVSHISCPSSTHDISLVSSFFLRHVISCDLMSRF
jgi:hypothetical protein